MDYANMTTNQIQLLINEEVRLELNQELTEEKQKEILKLHNILYARYLKYKESDLLTRKRIFRTYIILIHERNIEKYYNLPMIKFHFMFLNGETEY